MARFDLDYVTRKRPRRIVGWALLAIGVLLAADIGRTTLATREAVQTLERGAQSAPSASPSAMRRVALDAGPPLSAEDIKSAETIARRLTVPWESLFTPLEAARVRGIRLNSVLPDPERRVVTLTGEAKDYLAVLNYVATLTHDGALSRVRLVRHEMRAQDPRFTVSFEIAAEWGRTP